ncbi:MAG: ribonuclease E/G [Rhodobacteraceae bacterium]|nr:ribonuclease E/G [Paracoccaceae bacterium]
MKRGRIILTDTWRGRDCAVLITDGAVQDLLVDADTDTPRPGAIYRAKTLRPMKGQGGLTLDLGTGKRGYLRHAKGIRPGQVMLVQVTSFAGSGKASPVTPKLIFKGRYAAVTPGTPGWNLARRIRNEAERDRLNGLVLEGMDGAAPNLGLIIRSAADGTEDRQIAEDIATVRRLAEAVVEDVNGPPQLLVDAPTAEHAARRDWPAPDEVLREAGCLANLGLDEVLDDLFHPAAPLPGGGMLVIEPTTAFVAVDVNTGGDTSFAAGLKANLGVAQELPRQLRLRGLGGQIVVDMAPMAQKERCLVADAFRKSLRADRIETRIVGWTSLGHLELQRKRVRIPLTLALGKTSGRPA